VHTAADGTVTATLSGVGKVLGDLAAIGFILALLSSGSTWIMGADRSQAVAGYDGAAPRSLGYFSARWGTPLTVNLLSGLFSTIVMVLAFALTGNADKYFTAVLGLAISTTTISYLFVFPAVIKLRYSHGHVPRPYHVPGGMAGVWLAGGLCTLWSALATVVLLYPGFATSHPDASLPDGWSGQRGSYELSLFIPLLALIALGLLFYALGAPTRRQKAALPVQAPVGAAP
jgi:amino acid transporter